ncbi:MAG: PAS domain S-box protein [Candidatus Cloacimonadota bacterium]|nr:PAS domain S-box protein [Candidatus Cloacimonadota bacterium]
MNKKKILIIDDDEGIRESLSDILDEEGYYVKSASDGKTAKEFFEKDSFHLVLVDVNLPDISGLELISQLKKISLTSEYIIITGHASLETAIISVQSKEILSYEKKPLDMYHFLNFITETFNRKEAVEELQKSEERFRDMANLLPQIIYEIDLKGNLTFVNKQVFNTFGYSQKEFDKGFNFLKALIPEDRYRAKKHIQNILHGIEFGNPEYTALRKNGSTFPILIYSNVILKDNEPAGMRGIIVDITEQKKSEEEIRKLSTAVTQSPSVIAITDLKGNLEYVNPKFTEITGYTFEEAIGQNPRILKAGNLPDEMYEDLWDTISSGNIWRGEFHNKRKNGELFWEAASISPIFDKHGTITNYVKVAEDITERKKAAEELKLSEKKYRTVFENTGTATVIIEEDTIISLANSKCEQLTGYSKEEIEGKMKWTQLIAKDDLERMKSHHNARRAKDGEAPNRYEFKLIDKFGKIHYIFIEIDLIPGTKRSIASLLDITELKQAEKIQNTIFNISTAVNTTQNLNELYLKIQEYLGEIIDTTNFYVALYDEKTDLISLPYIADKKDKILQFPAGKTLTAYVIKTGKPLFAPETIFRELSKQGKVEMIGPDSKIWLGVPLKIDNIVTGVVAVQSYDNPNLYTENDLEILEFVSGEIAQAIKSKQAEMNIKESQLRYKKLFTKALTPILLVEPETRFIEDVNPATLKLFGYTRNELIGKPLCMILPEEKEQTQNILNQVSKAQEGGIRMGTKTVIIKNGEHRILDASFSFYVYFGKPLIQIIAVDITEKIRTQEKLREELKENRSLLMEIHHRVRNNWQMIDSLMNLQTGYVEDEKALTLFIETQDRIRSMALVHDHLYNKESLHNINMGKYFEQIVHELFNLYSADLGNINLEFDIKDVKMDIEIASPCGMIVNEIVTNSLKHGFPNRRDGIISVSLKKTSPNIFTLVVKDNGIGIPAELDLHDAGAFGFELITMLGEGQLGGKLTLDRSQGTEFTLIWGE